LEVTEASGPDAEANWFLSADERGNPYSDIDRRHRDQAAWTVGNRVRTLVHGASYFAKLRETIESLGEGDSLHFTDWRGDPDERLGEGSGTEIGALLMAASRRGAQIKGLVWRSHSDRLGFSAKQNRHLGQEVNAGGGEVLLDQRVHRGGSHHQKFIVVRRRNGPEGDLALLGGIDLCHGRRDDEQHLGDPQPQPMPKVYGATPPWHDVQVCVEGPAVGDLDLSFRERWDDPHPTSRDLLGVLQDPLRRLQDEPSRLPPMPSDPPARGSHSVQILRTYPPRVPAYPFAPRGERSIARAYLKALRRARRLIYIEDQFLWSREVMQAFADALAASPDLHLIAVVPRFFDQSGLAVRPSQVGRLEALRVLEQAARERVAIFDLENKAGSPVYVHAKVCVIDDVWAGVGSDNLDRRSWTCDSEIACAVLDAERDARPPLDPAGLGDGARRYARDLRLQLWREHLDRAPGEDADLLDSAQAVSTLRRVASELDRWYQDGCRGPRPPGRLRAHHAQPVSALARLWAEPIYRLVYDPDARPRALRGAGRW